MVGITDVRSIIRISLTAALLTSRSKVCLVFHIGMSRSPRTFEGEHVVLKLFTILLLQMFQRLRVLTFGQHSNEGNMSPVA